MMRSQRRRKIRKKGPSEGMKIHEILPELCEYGYIWNLVSTCRNFKLLSFGDEAEEDEEESVAVSKKLAFKSKSSHDLTNDPKLSSVPAVEVPSRKGPSEELQSSEEDDEPPSKEQDRYGKMPLSPFVVIPPADDKHVDSAIFCCGRYQQA